MSSPIPPVTGSMQELEPGIRRVLAPNASPMTYWGTNTFVLGQGNVAVIDPGPNDPVHLQAILDGLEPGERVTSILVTHAHLDHSQLARPLSDITGAPIVAFGRADEGRSPVMQDLIAQGMKSGGEGIDTAFEPDIRLRDGEHFEAGGLDVEAIWTPGHLSNHVCFATNGAVFTGDHVMGWASSLVSPPDGDLTAFMASCHKLAARKDHIYYPAHGDQIKKPAARLEWLINHRLGREASILSALQGGNPMTIPGLAAQIYTDTPPKLMPAAERNIFAHLIDLHGRNLVLSNGPLSAHAKFTSR